MKSLLDLKAERNKLIKLATKKRALVKRTQALKAERIKVNNEIRNFKLEVGQDLKSVLRRESQSLRSKVTSPETKRRVKRVASNFKSGYKRFQKFADRVNKIKK